MAGSDIETNTVKKMMVSIMWGNVKDGILVLSTVCFKPSVNIISNVEISNCRIDGDIAISGCYGCRLSSNSLTNSSIIVKF